MFALARVRPHNQVADEVRNDEEAQRQADHRKYDKDHDHRLDFEEFVSMVKMKSPKMSDETLKEIFNEMDRNGDGSISLKEYRHMRSPTMRALRFVKSKSMMKIYKSVILLAAYVLLGVFVFPQLEEGWTHTDALYFSMATMSTVGYGDISPSSDGTRAFTMFMIFFGLLFVFVEVANIIGFITMPLTKWGRTLLERAFPQVGIDIDGDGVIDFYKPRPPLVYYSKNLLPSFLLIMVLQFSSAAIFHSLDPSNTFWLWFYHCMVTATTVGYGDVYNGTQAGRLWSCFHIMLSVAMLGELISTFDELAKKRAATLARIQQLGRKLDKELLDQLLNRAKAMRPLVIRDGKGLTELEFVLAMLVELHVVEWEMVRPFILQFRTLDVNGDARLGHDDLDMFQTHSKEELNEMRRQADVPMTVAGRMGVAFFRDANTASDSNKVTSTTTASPRVAGDAASIATPPLPPIATTASPHRSRVGEGQPAAESTGQSAAESATAALATMTQLELEALYAAIGAKLGKQ